MRGVLCALLAVACVVTSAGVAEAGAPGSVREVTAYQTESSPIIDGLLDDAAWATAAKADSVITAFGLPDGWGPARDDLTAYVTYDEQALYLAIVNASIASDLSGRESLELQVMLDPGHFHAVGGWLWIGEDGEVVQNGFRDPRSIRAASLMSETGWVVELAIPFVEWGGTPVPGALWGFNVGGSFGRDGESPTWQPTFGPYAQPGKWGHLRFAGPLIVEHGGPVAHGSGVPSVRTARAFRVEQPPEVDGTTDDAVWAEIARNGGVLGGFTKHQGVRLAEVPSFAALGYDAENLYLYVRSYRIPGARLTSGSDTDENETWDDDHVELMFSRSVSGRDGLWIVANASGELHMRGAQLWGDVQSIEAETRVEEAAWTLEMRVPFSVLGTEAPDSGDIWRFNVGGHRVEADEWPTWQPTGGPYEWVTLWGRLEFADAPSEVSSTGRNPMESQETR